MKKTKPIALILFDASFLLFTILSIVLQLSNTGKTNQIALFTLSSFTIIFSIFLWYFSSRRGVLWGKILLSSFFAVKSFFLIQMMRVFWSDDIRIAFNISLLTLIALSTGSILHPSVKIWRERQMRGDAEVFE